MTRAIHPLKADWQQRGFDAIQTRDEASIMASELMRHPAYFDAKHVEHGDVVRQVGMLYELAQEPEAE